MVKTRAGHDYPGTMKTYAALLRGVNVGKNKLAMVDFRTVLAELGAGNVRTYLQSGNAVFSHPTPEPAELARAIEEGLAGLGVTSRVLLRTGQQLAAVLAENPFLARESDPVKLHVTFLAERPAPDRVPRLQVPAGETATFHLTGTEVYLHCPDGYGRTKLSNSFIESRLGIAATTRNWRTVTALAELTGTD
ncbi:DUF1697 domain-containing protein [Jatrophihabitans sp.]|uniref:DUF1697 domain-containing protein n=1 Tax=Jatrophihabitans sp. TaxID=1932789 RepID=UPI002C394A32|nr:DUF1697 domain-containing protein [Jatrophihabitans sp.]